MSTYTYRIIIEPDGKQFHAYVPALRGCHTFGKTIAEAKKRVREAIICHLQGLVKDGGQVPREEDSFEMIHSISARELAVGR